MSDENDEHYEDYIADREPSFRPHTEIAPDELTSALRSLELLKGELYLGLQVENLTVIDQFIMGVEQHTLQEYIRTERTPPETMFLNAQSQMWIFAAYELLRTWRARAKDVIKWADNGGLETKAAALEEDQGFLHTSREMRAEQLRKIAANPRKMYAVRRSHTYSLALDLRFRGFFVLWGVSRWELQASFWQWCLVVRTGSGIGRLS